MVQRCCCCINLRVGTILISLLVLVQSVIGAYVAFSFVDSATKFSKGLGYVHGIWNVIRGLIAIGGLVGAIWQNHKLVGFFSWIISISAMIYLVFGLSISIISLKNKGKLVEMCLEKISEQRVTGNYWSPLNHWSKPFDKRQEPNANSTIPQNSQSEKELCQQAVNFYLGFAITYTIIGSLLMFYFASVTANYKEELRKNEMLKKIDFEGSRSIGSKSDNSDYQPEKPPPRGISTDL